ncbi:lipopolysaccharide biosynthesis protein [Abyssicoccus albus]|uniref:lipopolysaccharide biosynthesis protein n=1 Tax=Abyssicoccus albus TaxID=1817405 RepID=UPI00097E3EC7|nr:oligosaccharide flippase family protein [Abyssicoccus albus]AQL55900.1 hypothetical protein BVH56_02685 [Abyssicoccus albus]
MNRFYKNLMIFASGTILAQVYALLTMPIITRLFSSNDIGVMNLFVSACGLFAPIAALTFPIALILPKETDEFLQLKKLTIQITFLVSGFMLLVFLCFRSNMMEIFNFSNSFFLYLIPFVTLCAGLLQILENSLLRYKYFKVSAKTSFTQSLYINSLKIISGLVIPTQFSLIMISSGSNLVKIITILIQVYKKKAYEVIKVYPQKIDHLKLIKKYIDFPIYRAPQVLIHAFSQNVPIILLGFFYNPSIVAYYSIGISVLNVPVNLIGRAIGDVTYTELNDRTQNGEPLYPFVLKIILLLSLIFLIPLILIIFYGTYLFETLFGNNWSVAGEMAKWTILWVMVLFIYQPVIKSYPIIKAQRFHLIYTIINLILRIATIIISHNYFNNYMLVIICYSIVSMIINIILLIISLYLISKFDKRNLVKTNAI